MQAKRQHVKRSIRHRIGYLFMHSDLEALRFFVAASSLLWGVMLALPGTTFDRQTYELMAAVAPELAWAVAHFLHAGAAIWALLSGRNGKIWFIASPVLGCLIWTTSAIAMLFSVWPVPAAIAPHIVGAAASWWLLVRYKDGR